MRILVGVENGQFDDVVAQMPYGLYHVGENGVKLSGGQRQRLALARAFCGAVFLCWMKPQVLLITEPYDVLQALDLVGRRCLHRDRSPVVNRQKRQLLRSKTVGFMPGDFVSL